jgi:uncharacterized protein (TIRG00374 family)
VLLSVGAVLLLAFTLDVGEAFAVLQGASLGALALVLPVVAAQVLVRAARWRLLLPRRPDGSRATLGATVTALLVGYLASGVLPARLGEPIRALVVARSQRLPASGAFGAVVLERVVDLATLAIVGLGAALAVGAPGWIVNLATIVAFLAIALLVLLTTVGLDPLLVAGRRVETWLPASARPTAARTLALAGTFADGMSGHRRRPDVAWAAALSVVGWLLDAAIVWLVGSAIGLSLGLGEAVVISSVGALATAVPSAPGYLGTFEVAVTAAAVALGLTGAEGLALAIATHAIVLVPVLGAGVIALARTGFTLGSLAESTASPTLDGAPAS